MFSIKLHPVTLKLILPVGISFYTFQTISYVIDVYRGKINSEKDFIAFAAFISYFPQLVAGPIERTSNLLPQIKQKHYFNYIQASYGLKLMLIGYYKKIVIADVLAQYVDEVYSHLHLYQGFDLFLAILFFTIQIYCDFSGYSDIAIGTSKLLGIDLMTNFKSPYFSSSLKEFWSRWHISLSTWFRDYVYIPLGGNRCSTLRTNLNLLATFLVSGLWHGANWTYIVWGGLHGFFQIVEKGLMKYKIKAKYLKPISTIAVFAFCNITWVFFRANTFADAFYIFTNVFAGITNIKSYLVTKLNLNAAIMLQIIILILIVAIYDYFNKDEDIIECISHKNRFVRWSAYVIIGLLIVFYSQKGVGAEFVYFQF